MNVFSKQHYTVQDFKILMLKMFLAERNIKKYAHSKRLLKLQPHPGIKTHQKRRLLIPLSTDTSRILILATTQLSANPSFGDTPTPPNRPSIATTNHVFAGGRMETDPTVVFGFGATTFVYLALDWRRQF